jgi:excisionase family DNA binding protein
MDGQGSTTRHIRLMKVDRVADDLDCSVNHVKNLIRDGVLPAVRFGTRGVRVRSDELGAFCASLPRVGAA